MWLLILSRSGGYVFHSAHRDKATAEAWRKCKEHDNEDCALVEITGETLDDFVEAVTKLAQSM